MEQAEVLMRPSLIAVLFLGACMGCDDQVTAVAQDAGMDAAAESGDMAGLESSDMAVPPGSDLSGGPVVDGATGDQGPADLRQASGDQGSGDMGACNTACDCAPGLACFAGRCTASPLGMLYCCSSATCPAGSFCEDTSGNFGRCPGGATDGGTDGGGGNLCTLARCSPTRDRCATFGCGACNAATNRCTSP
jgi:hypothetical protein